MRWLRPGDGLLEEPADGRDDSIDLVVGEFGIHGQGLDAPADRFGHRIIARLAALIGVAALKVQGHRVVDERGNARGFEVLLQGILSIGQHGVDMPHVRIAGGDDGQLDGQAGQSGRIPSGDRGPALIPTGQVRELHAEDGRLKFIEPRIKPVQVVVVTLLDAVDAQHPQLLGEGWILGDAHTTIAVGTKVLGGIKTEAANTTDTREAPAFPRRTDGLSTVFYQRQSVALAQGQQVPKRRCLTEEMYRQQGLGARRDAPGHVDRIEGEGPRINVGENHLGPQLMNALGRGNIGERRRDDLVARTDVEGLEGQRQGVGARIDTDAMGGSAEGRDLLFEGCDIGAQNEVAGIDAAVTARSNSSRNGAVCAPGFRKAIGVIG